MTETITRSFQFKDVNRVNFSAIGTIRLVQGDEESVLVEGSEEALEHIKISQDQSTINIRLFTWYDFLFIPRPASYTIRVKKLEAFSINGSAEMDCEQLTNPERPLELHISGSGRIAINELKCLDLHVSSSGAGNYKLQALETNQVRAGISGSGNFYFSGTANEVDLHISGSGDINAAGLACKTSSARISGSGRISTNVSDALNVHISGSGEVAYSGNPKIEHSISGSGKVRQI